MSVSHEKVKKLQGQLTRWIEKGFDEKYERLVMKLLRETAGLIEGDIDARRQVGFELGSIEECLKPEWWAEK